MTKVVNDIKHIFTAANELTGEDKKINTNNFAKFVRMCMAFKQINDSDTFWVVEPVLKFKLDTDSNTATMLFEATEYTIGKSKNMVETVVVLESADKICFWCEEGNNKRLENGGIPSIVHTEFIVKDIWHKK